MIIEEYTTPNGGECVLVTYEDGTVWSGIKSVWEEEQAKREQSGTLS